MSNAQPTPRVVPDPELRRWPLRLRELGDVLRSDRGDAIRRAALEEAWLLLHAALHRFLRHHAARFGSVHLEDLQDLCSEKSLELVRRIESGQWDLSGRDGGEIAGFVSTVARNGLVDLFRERDRTVVDGDAGEAAGRSEPHPLRTAPESPEVGVERKDFAGALLECARGLSPRDRAAWFLRVFYDLPSRDIAAHPDVVAKASHVDVILQRSRRSVRDCMKGKGRNDAELPPGTFTQVWAAFRHQSFVAFGGSHESH